MLTFFIFSFVVLAASSHGSQLHEQMTPEELKLTFNQDEVPEYEVVPIAHAIHENSPEDSPHRVLQIRSFKRDMRLYLEPTEGFLAGKETPIWTVKSDPSSPLNLTYTRLTDGLKSVNYFYQDPYNLAAISSSFDENGEILFEGTIGDDLVVRPLPKRLRKEFTRSKRSVEEDFPLLNRTVYHPNLKHTYHHVVFKKKEAPLDGMREKIGSYVLKDKSSRFKRDTDEATTEIRKIVYPQILVVIDYSHFQTLKTIDEVKRYVISFWNAVDLRYRVFLKPEVRINIAGIVVAAEPNGVPFTQNHRNKPADGPLVDADKAISSMAEYYYKELMDKDLQRFVLDKDFDMVMLMTQLNLCNLEPADDDFDCTTLGYAFREGACTVNANEKTVEAVGLIEDNGGYIGILPAAHEVGHLLGAPHDGSRIQDDDEEAKTRCPAYGGYIMNGMLMLTENAFTWSSCSMEYFADFFKSPKAECLVNPPKMDKTSVIRRILPGEILTIDEQCDRIRGTHACNHDDTACVHLDCFVPDSGNQCLPVAPAAEGSSCGEGHYCINGKCVDKKNTTEITLEFAPPPPDRPTLPFPWVVIPEENATEKNETEENAPIIVERD